MDFLKEFFRFLKTRKKFWMVPLILILLLLALLIAISGASALAPFIYSIF